MADHNNFLSFVNEAVTLEESKFNAVIETAVDEPLGWSSHSLGISVRDFITPSQHTTNPPLFDVVDFSPPFVTETRIRRYGGTSQLSQVTIHPSHKEGCSKSTDNRLDKPQEHLYALKQFHVGNDDDLFREAISLQRLAQTPHPHIVPLLTSYREKRQYHLVFPWADGDLAMFWRLHPTPPHDKGTLGWVGRQMLGLADALFIVHGSTKENEITSSYGVHGDLKPANILCFRDAPERHTLAIADFGSSYFLPSDEKENAKPRNIKRTPAYRAPEVDITSEGVTQAYDI